MPRRPRATIPVTSCEKKMPLSREDMAHDRTSCPTLFVLLASVVCGCASSPAEHVSTATSPAAVAAPATSTSVLALAASQAPAAAAASNNPNPAAALASTTTTSTAAVTATAKSADAKAPNADSKVTCHREVPTGSRVSVKVCETEAVRKAREATVRDTRDTLSRPTPGCPQLGPGGCVGGGG
jgi:hypothetical protein